MTTAHRPTFDTARGGTGRGENDLSKLSTQYSARDMPSHLKLKYRQPGQAHPDEIRQKNYRYELEDAERDAKDRKRQSVTEAIEAAGGVDAPTHIKKSRFDTPVTSTANPDADEPVDNDSDTDDDDDDDDSEDDAELLAELERIKRERAVEKAKKEEAEREEADRLRQEALVRGNPLLNLHNEEPEFKVKRRWDDDVVFKNCAKGISERKKAASFINDSIRSEFHRKFMDKYIK